LLQQGLYKGFDVTEEWDMAKTSTRLNWWKAGQAAIAMLIGMATPMAGPVVAQQPQPMGTVLIDEEQISFIFSGQGGGGVLNYGDATIPFKIGGLGVGGFGISKIRATGEVYQLNNVNDFFGAYVAARVGWAVGLASGGHIWLENPNGVVLHLKAEREGLILSLGADAIVISPQ
jgi:hypothetical protein